MTWLGALPTDRLIDLRAELVKYSEDQPRVPAGSPEGGEFAGSGGGSFAAPGGFKPGDNIKGTVWQERFEKLAARGATSRSPEVSEAFGMGKNPIMASGARFGFSPEESLELARFGTQWNDDSDTPGAKALQRAAVEDFGANQNQWTARPDVVPDEDVRKAATLIELSQTLLREQLGDRAMTGTVTVYRGLEMDYASTPRTGETIGLSSNALSSWSTSKDEADTFGNVLLKMDVPLVDVAGVGGTGLGNAIHQEVVVIGREGQTATVVNGR